MVQGVGVGDFGKVWKSMGRGRGEGEWKTTARVRGREGAACGHLDSSVGTQRLLLVPTLLLLCPSQKQHLNLSPRVLPSQLWEPADLDSREAA